MFEYTLKTKLQIGKKINMFAVKISHIAFQVLMSQNNQVAADFDFPSSIAMLVYVFTSAFIHFSLQDLVTIKDHMEIRE